MLFDISGVQPAKRRPGGWYDDKLVTQAGEAILARLDGIAIAAFRANGMLFSQRRDEGAELGGANYSVPAPQIDGVFKVQVADTLSIKLFGMSMLWRAAATSRPEFNTVRLPDDALEELRDFIVGNRTPKYWEFPVILSVFSNQYQFTDLTPQPVTMRGVRFVRWCLDGVIMYVATRRRANGGSQWAGISVGRYQNQLAGLIMQYENGWQQRMTRSNL